MQKFTILGLLVWIQMILSQNNAFAKDLTALCESSGTPDGLKIQLPLQTNWNGHKYEFGAESLINDVLNLKTSFNVYAGHYFGQNFNTDNVPSEAVQIALHKACLETGVAFDLIHAKEGVSNISENSNRVKIFQGDVVSDSMVTIILPPNWSRTRQKRFPLLINGFYGVNINLVNQEGPDILKSVANSVDEIHDGVIGVLWNGGADHGRTFDKKAQEVFAKVLTYIQNKFNGDKHNIVMTGGSRGGVTSLIMASNPNNYDYKVRYADAVAAPTRIGTHATLASTTYFDVISAFIWDTNNFGSWHPDWISHDRNFYSGIENYLSKMVGPSSVDIVDNDYSLISDKYINALKDQGTSIYLTIKTHDAIVPAPLQYEYYLKLKKFGIPVKAEVHLYVGHSGLTELKDERYERLNRAIYSLALHNQSSNNVNTIFLPNTDLDVYAFNGFMLNGRFSKKLSVKNALPFTMDIPAIAFNQNSSPIVIASEPGTKIKVFMFDKENLINIIDEEISSTGFLEHRFQYKQSTDETLISYFTMIKKPNENWKIIQPTNAPGITPSEVTTKVMPLPSISNSREEVIRDIFNPITENSPRPISISDKNFTTSRGISEFNPSGSMEDIIRENLTLEVSDNHNPLQSITFDADATQVIHFQKRLSQKYKLKNLSNLTEKAISHFSCFYQTGLNYQSCDEVFTEEGFNVSFTNATKLSLYLISDYHAYTREVNFLPYEITSGACIISNTEEIQMDSYGNYIVSSLGTKFNTLLVNNTYQSCLSRCDMAYERNFKQDNNVKELFYCHFNGDKIFQY